MKRSILQILVAIALIVLTTGLYAQSPDNSDLKQSGNLWGYVFGDYYWKQHADSAGRGGKNVQYSSATQANAVGGNSPTTTGANAFQIRRAYLGYDYNLTPQISAHTVLANEQDQDESGNNTTYLKYMYVEWKNILPQTNILIGQMPTPAYSLRPFGTASLWGYRSVERTLLDMHNIDQSTDLGAAIQGNIWQEKVSDDNLTPSIVGYEIMVGNGNAAKPETDIFKKFRGTVYASFFKQQLTFGLYADYNRTALSPVIMYDNTYKVYADYKSRIFKIGFEAFEEFNKNENEYMGEGNTVYSTGLQQGLSLFLSGKILENLNYFARFDMYNPDKKYNNNETYTATKATSFSSVSVLTYDQAFTDIGFDYTITKRMHIMPNLWYNRYESKIKNAADKLKSDYDLVPRITFFIIFNKAKHVDDNGMDD